MQVADCYGSLDDHEKLVRSCAEIICHQSCKRPVVTAIQRSMYFRRMEDALKAMGEQLCIDGKLIFDIKCTKIMLKHNEKSPPTNATFTKQNTFENSGIVGSSQNQHLEFEEEKIISGSELILQLDIDSYFPATIYASIIKVAMTFTEQSSLPPYSEDCIEGNKMNRNIHPLSKKHQQNRRHSVQRSHSTRSNASSIASELSCSSYSNQSLQYNNALDVDNKQDICDVVSSNAASGNDNTSEKVSDQGPDSVKWVDVLKLREIRDYKQDRSLSAVRLVCRNSAFVLRRKESTGSMLSSSSTDSCQDVTKSDYSLAFTNKMVHSKEDKNVDQTSSSMIALNPGRNRVHLTAVAGSVGEYMLTQLSITAFDEKLEILTQLRQISCSLNVNRLNFRVISQPVTMSLTPYKNATLDLHKGKEWNNKNPEAGPCQNNSSVQPWFYSVDEPLWAGICQLVKLSLYMGSFCFTKETEMNIECSSGLIGSQVLMDDDKEVSTTLSTVFKVKLPVAEPFTTATIVLNVRSNLIKGALENGQHFEHSLKVPNIWSLNTDPENSENNTSAITTLYLSFLSPFLCQGKVQTAFTKKFFNVEIFSTSTSLNFELKNHKLSLINHECQSEGNSEENETEEVKHDAKITSHGINVVPVQGKDDTMVRVNCFSRCVGNFAK